MQDNGTIVNLRLARKARRRTEGESQAAQNRARFGRTKAERQRDEEKVARLQSTLDGAKRERSED